ncbi:hypothetical protein AUK22_06010 [bacterium CG2_30_54_10]|nr:MAG: hypothetical protein AUK22_06010 [bacterium CG2_30_54_10]
MAEYLTIAEVSRLTGVAPHTIRFYERQFPKVLAVERSPGGHRQFRSRDVESLQRILSLVRHERLSIHDAQLRLGEAVSPPPIKVQTPSSDSNQVSGSIRQVLEIVLEKLDSLCQSNAHLESLFEETLQKNVKQDSDELLGHIAKRPDENLRSLPVTEGLLNPWKNSDEH